MEFKAKIEGFTTHQIISLILEMLKRVSDENLVRLTYLGEKLTSKGLAESINRFQ